MELEDVRVDPMMNRPEPRQPFEWLSLRFADRYKVAIRKGFEGVADIRQIQPAMQGRHERHSSHLAEREHPIVMMIVNDVELVRAGGHFSKQLEIVSID